MLREMNKRFHPRLFTILFSVLLAFISTLSSTEATVAFATTLDGWFTKYSFHEYTRTKIAIIRVTSEFECTMRCHRHEYCLSFNFAVKSDSDGKFVCELLKQKNSIGRPNYVASDKFHHFVAKRNFCTANVKKYPLLKEDNTYDCICKPGYTGMRCEIDINECASNPCVQGRGQCQDQVNAYKCNCIAGYTGKKCEEEIDECQSNPCLHGGTCTDLFNDFKCVCIPGRHGKRCYHDINECSSNPCHNGATCEDKLNSYTCQCVPGYSGTRCETNINECASNPCGSGTCQDKVNGYDCVCSAGYTGAQCEVDINECLSNPCLNGATCENKVNSYTCQCVTGYSGTRCETRIDFVTIAKSFQDAESDCITRGLKLVKVDDATLNSLLKEKFTSDFWIGLHRKGSKWRWSSDNKELKDDDFEKWDDSQQSWGKCVLAKHDNGKWQKSNCNSARPYACKDHS